MENRIADIQSRLTSITEELTEVSVDLLRSALEAGETTRPAMDKKLSQARRAVEKAARLLEQEPAELD
ncbi:MAG: hypothetical protein ACR2QK_24435 [Acidimicrobiales bacterium]